MALKQPPFRPPPYVFGPAWTLLYGLMGYSAYRAMDKGLTPTSSIQVINAAKHGFTLYSIQLGLNLVWMPLFFILKRPIAATVEIVALTGVVGYLTYVWGQVDAVAGWALAPYLGWLGFATYLTGSCISLPEIGPHRVVLRGVEAWEMKDVHDMISHVLNLTTSVTLESPRVMSILPVKHTNICTVGVGYLNDWDIGSKEVDFPPTHKGKDTKYVDEE